MSFANAIRIANRTITTEAHENQHRWHRLVLALPAETPNDVRESLERTARLTRISWDPPFGPDLEGTHAIFKARCLLVYALLGVPATMAQTMADFTPPSVTFGSARKTFAKWYGRGGRPVPLPLIDRKRSPRQTFRDAERRFKTSIEASPLAGCI